MLEDAPALQGYLNSRLSLFVQQEEENQLLNGNDVGTHLNGLLNQVPAGNQDVTSDATSPNGADHIFAGIAKVAESFLQADGIVVNSGDWANLRLLKDGNATTSAARRSRTASLSRASRCSAAGSR